MSLTMDKILGASLGEDESQVRASFKKTVFIRQYESEVMELETTLKLDKPITSVERMVLSSILSIQLEYTAYVQLAYKGLVTVSELDARRDSLEKAFLALKSKGEQILGKSLDYLLEYGGQ